MYSCGVQLAKPSFWHIVNYSSVYGRWYGEGMQRRNVVQACMVHIGIAEDQLQMHGALCGVLA